MPLETTPASPLPVRRVAQMIGDWIGRLGRIWVDGQLTEITRRPGSSTVFLTLRDPDADVSLRLTAPLRLYDGVTPALSEGSRVVVWAKPDFYARRGTLSLQAFDIRPVGVGELLARLERLKGVLAAEGLFAPERKVALPFLPRVVGLVCGRASDAEHDVVQNARRRWPAVRFRIETVAVQGVNAVAEVIPALRRLDADPEVDVIVVTRGGGSVEDLLPFSDEAMVRAVATCRTPVVSAIGHEQDTPLLDLVADFRASTPTDAAKRIVPDVAEEQARIVRLRREAYRALAGRLEREHAGLAALRSRPSLAAPLAGIDRRESEINGLRDRARRCLTAALDRADDDLAHTLARVVSLSPDATLQRGYAVVQHPDGGVVREASETGVGEQLAVRLASGRLTVNVTTTVR